MGSDHNLVVGEVWLKLRKSKAVSYTRPYTIEGLKNEEISSRFREDVSNGFRALQHSHDLEEQWSQFTQAIKESTNTVLGKRRGSNKERWISANSWKLIDKRKVAKATRDQTRLGWRQTDEVYRCLDKELKKSCRTEKNADLRTIKASEAQTAADNNDPKTLYRIVRELTGARSNAWFV